MDTNSDSFHSYKVPRNLHKCRENRQPSFHWHEYCDETLKQYILLSPKIQFTVKNCKLVKQQGKKNILGTCLKWSFKINNHYPITLGQFAAKSKKFGNILCTIKMLLCYAIILSAFLCQKNYSASHSSAYVSHIKQNNDTISSLDQ